MSDMSSIQRLLAALALEASSVILTLTTGVFGGAALFIQLRLLDIHQFYLLQLAAICLFAAFQVYSLAILVLALGALVAVYANLEKSSLFKKGFLASLTGTSILLVAIYGWVVLIEKQELWPYLIETFDFYIKKSATIKLPLDVKTIVYQLPSYIFCICALNIWTGVLFDKQMRVLKRKELKNFTVPDGFIWIVIGSLLFSFVKVDIPGVQEIALNLLNVSLLLYFFQGLSVLVFILDAMRFSTLIKYLIYFIFVFQILLPICLGILEYWLGLRNRFSKKNLNAEKE